MDDFVKLPSGGQIDIRHPDFSLCKTADDMLEVKYALSEKIIDLELQIDMFETGAGVAAGRSYTIDWFPRAKAALKWTKLYRDEAQNRQGRLSAIAAAQTHARMERGISDLLAEVLTPEQFANLRELAAIIQKLRVEVKQS